MDLKKLKRKLAESELVGLLHGGVVIVTGALGRLFEDPKDAEMQQAMIDSQDQHEKELEETVQRFISSRPHLSPQAYGVPEGRYRASACFGAAQAVELLLKRVRRHRLESKRPDGRFLLEADGTVRSANGEVLVPARSVQMEVARFVSLGYVPKKEEMTWSLAKALRQKRDRFAEVHVRNAIPFLAWLQAALRNKPDLMCSFTAGIHPGEGPDAVVLTEKPVDPLSTDHLDGWKIG
jgi:HEPN domain-containing protein